MERKAKPLLGLVPIGKFVFSHEDAVIYKDKTRALLDEMAVGYVDLEDVLPDGMVHIGSAVHKKFYGLQLTGNCGMSQGSVVQCICQFGFGIKFQ